MTTPDPTCDDCGTTHWIQPVVNNAKEGGQ